MYPDESALNKLTPQDTMPFHTMKACMLNILQNEIFLPVLNNLDRSTPREVDLDKLFEYTESLDRYFEILSILDRALLKIDGTSQVPPRPKFSMNLISLALKANS
jgi:hypothetical protein